MYHPASIILWIETQQNVESRLVGFAFIIFHESVLKNPIIFCGVEKECHGRPKFQIVGMAENLQSRAAFRIDNKPGAFSQPCTQNMVCHIGFSLIQGSDCIMLCHGAMTQPSDLREYEPYPMTFFPA